MSSELTLELYRFLTVKQLVLRTKPSESAEDSLQVSPGFMVDALWHAVLLESEVSSLQLLMLQGAGGACPIIEVSFSNCCLNHHCGGLASLCPG